MSQKKCCVPGCLTTKRCGILHKFPNPERDIERFTAWILNIGGEIATLDHGVIYDNRRVCYKHFKDIHKYPSKTLCRLAIPVLNMPGQQLKLPEEVIASEHVSMVPGMKQFPNFGVQTSELSMELPIPSTSEVQNIESVILTSEPSIFKTTSEESPLPSTSNMQNIQHDTLTSGYQKNLKKEALACVVKHSSQQKKVKSKGPYVSPAQHKEFKAVLKQLENCEKGKRNFKRKYILAKKMIQTNAFKIVSKQMSATARIFCQMQYSQSGKKKQGRRFTLDEKILALSLYKPSPKAYRLLSKLCVLPNRRTLQNLLHKINLTTGINEIIFVNLEKRVSKMPNNHKYCTLMFDEMAIGPGITFDKRNDKIIGLVDNGEATEKEYCDHVLVFMIRGTLKKYKQPLAYYFCSGSTKAVVLKVLIKQIICKIQATGLKVVATVCDQGTSNVAAINSLLNETRSTYIRSNKTYTEGFFEINNEKIFPVYDPPHLMKGIRNNLITKNLKYTIKGKECVAKWSHIMALYERCPGYKGVKLVPKLTAHHVVPSLIPKMRVKHCTQVFSKSVGVALGCMAGMQHFL